MTENPGRRGVFSPVPFLNQDWHPYRLGGKASGKVTCGDKRWTFGQLHQKSSPPDHPPKGPTGAHRKSWTDQPIPPAHNHCDQQQPPQHRSSGSFGGSRLSRQPPFGIGTVGMSALVNRLRTASRPRLRSSSRRPRVRLSSGWCHPDSRGIAGRLNAAPTPSPGPPRLRGRRNPRRGRSAPGWPRTRGSPTR